MEVPNIKDETEANYIFVKNGMKLFKVFREQWVHEDNLVNARLNIAVVFQCFAITAYTFSGASELFRFAIAISAMTVAALCHYSIRAAITAMESIQKAYATNVSNIYREKYAIKAYEEYVDVRSNCKDAKGFFVKIVDFFCMFPRCFKGATQCSELIFPRLTPNAISNETGSLTRYIPLISFLFWIVVLCYMIAK